ncbi:NADH-ubiquinone oxidoreductase-F iron-sulfur binding region domain-containing protein [Euzebya sp.]|uniref:NADH-ubiquinone oxidoreductase-F iron-sulfur binding region domain-containing protein n=1 Tax=Euzebya sp. TaxID=1971409 RepID=UPI003514F33D
MALLPDAPIETMADHLAAGGGEGLENAIALDPDEVIAEITESGLRGRGGAGFPTGAKWASVSGQPDLGDVYLVCNAAEGEPGTYKDRALIAANPFQLVEGVLIAAYAIGARGAVIAVKARHTHHVARLEQAIDAAVAAGWRGADRVELVTGPDEYLFGEEKAMLEVIEGKNPMPRILPPYMQGLFATMDRPNPTAVNNVETLSHVACILRDGAAAWRSEGTEGAPGTLVFTVTGDVPRPGVYELPLGTSLRTLICELAGAEEPRWIISGTSNTVITPDLLDLPMDFDSFAEAGTGLGSGGFVVYGADRDPVQVTTALAEFLAVESCGQCNACQLGTAAMADHLHALDEGRGGPEDLEGIRGWLPHVTDANRCYLPVGAQLTIGSMLDEFGEAFAARAAGAGAVPAEHRAPVPKIESLTEGHATFDPDYHRKRRDWSYADEG